MSVLSKLARAMGRRDELPNQALAAGLARRGDTAGIAELAEALRMEPVAVQNDAIKTLYEVGAIRPDLIEPHADEFFRGLKSRNNRLVWGAMAVLETLAGPYPKLIAGRLPEILAGAERGSVIAKDKAVSILATLACTPKIAPKAWDELMRVLRTSAVNQTPMYAEAALRAASSNQQDMLANVIRLRLEEISQPAKLARLEKVLRKLCAGL